MDPLSARFRPPASRFRTPRREVRKRPAGPGTTVHDGHMSRDLQHRLAACPWPAVHEDLHAKGVSVLPQLLDAKARAALRAAYDSGSFRNRVVMERHNYGRGEYKYFAYPLPPLVQDLREALYERLVPVAAQWAKTLETDVPP